MYFYYFPPNSKLFIIKYFYIVKVYIICYMCCNHTFHSCIVLAPDLKDFGFTTSHFAMLLYSWVPYFDSTFCWLNFVIKLMLELQTHCFCDFWVLVCLRMSVAFIFESQAGWVYYSPVTFSFPQNFVAIA